MIIIYGGAFNPPTIAHYEVAKYLINRYNPTSFIFVPVGDRYKKPNVIEFKHRYEMLKRLCQNFKEAIVSDFEQQFTTFKGTITTLHHFQEIYKNDEIFFVVGADHVEHIHTWIDYDKLLTQYKIIIVNRDNINIKEKIEKHSVLKLYQSSFIIESFFRPIEVSSSLYRHTLDETLVLNEIKKYIQQNNLYSRGIENEK